MRRTILLSLSLVALWALPVSAQQTQEDAAAKRRDIERLLEVTGATKLGLQLGGQMLEVFKKQNPSVPEAMWDELMKEFDTESLADLIIPIYDKHLTHEDIRGLIAFNESPLGQKINSVMPAILQESMQTGQQWGMEVAQRVLRKLEARKENPQGE